MKELWPKRNIILFWLMIISMQCIGGKSKGKDCVKRFFHFRSLVQASRILVCRFSSVLSKAPAWSLGPDMGAAPLTTTWSPWWNKLRRFVFLSILYLCLLIEIQMHCKEWVWVCPRAPIGSCEANLAVLYLLIEIQTSHKIFWEDSFNIPILLNHKT